MIEYRAATAADHDAITSLVAHRTAIDGEHPFSEFKALRMTGSEDVDLVVAVDEAVVAIAVVARRGEGYDSMEVAVESGAELSLLLPGLLAVASLSQPQRDIGLWLRHERELAAGKAAGLEVVRQIVQLQRELPGAAVATDLAIEVRPYDDTEDESLWLDLNRRVFASHPEAGRIDRSDFALLRGQRWWDPDGLQLLEVNGVAAGYCWAKIHPSSVGEIYMIGLAPQFRGMGLARPLAVAGLRYLSESGEVSSVMVYTESDNEAALQLYVSMGFERKRVVSLMAEISRTAANS